MAHVNVFIGKISVAIDINLDGQSIKHIETFKYLGVTIDETLSFNDHMLNIRTKVSKILGMFSRVRPLLTHEGL